jgi:hypothetical protein
MSILETEPISAKNRRNIENSEIKWKGVDIDSEITLNPFTSN